MNVKHKAKRRSGLIEMWSDRETDAESAYTSYGDGLEYYGNV